MARSVKKGPFVDEKLGCQDRRPEQDGRKESSPDLVQTINDYT